jgi:beta-galactosidase
MKSNRKRIHIAALLIACLLQMCVPGESASHEINEQLFQSRLVKLHKKIDAVAAALDDADDFPQRAGRIDLQAARFFAEYIAWELEHPEMMKDALLSSEYFNATPITDPVERDRRYLLHIDSELTGSMKVLDEALSRLKKQVSWPQTREIDWSTLQFADGYFRFQGRPAFFGGFNMLPRSLINVEEHPEWKTKDKSMTRSFLLKMKPLGVGIVGTGVSVPGLIMEDGSVNKPHIQELANTIRSYGQLGFKVDLLFHWRGKKATLEKLWPGITAYYGNSVHIDIDHPGTRLMISQVMAELIPALRDLPEIASWDMANEPFFNITMWSPFSLQKYRNWLTERYVSIDRLNANWKTSYADFREVPHPKGRAKQQCTPGEWYDRVTFHNTRVTEFFDFIQQEIRKYLPEAVVHLKAQDNSSLGPLPGAVVDGIDRELLTPMATLHGLDTRPLPVTEPRMAAANWDESLSEVLNYDGSLYAFHWLGQSFLYDYLTSLEPRRGIVDFEYHAFSINAIRVPNIRQSHPRAALWMAHLHGLVGNMAWYWHRRYGPEPFPGNYFKRWLHGSLSTQPVIAAEYFQTMLMLNAFAEEIEALATLPDRPVRLFVSKPSYIQNQAHINALHRAYEGTCFHGLRVGFVTEAILAKGGMPEDCKVLVIPDAEYVSKSALQALAQAQVKGVQLFRFGERKITYDEYGKVHAPQTLAFLDDLQVFEYDSAQKLSRKFENVLRPLTATLPVQIRLENSSSAFGVMHRQVNLGDNLIVLLVNLSSKPLRVQLQSNDGQVPEIHDMLNCESVDGNGIDMPIQGVRLLRAPR